HGAGWRMPWRRGCEGYREASPCPGSGWESSSRRQRKQFMQVIAVANAGSIRPATTRSSPAMATTRPTIGVDHCQDRRLVIGGDPQPLLQLPTGTVPAIPMRLHRDI